MLRFETAGESHGECLVATLTGLPAGIPISLPYLNRQLWRRQQGFGRGGRMKIETDRVHVVSGIRYSQTIGSPIAILLANQDWKNWENTLPVEGPAEVAVKVSNGGPPAAVVSNRPVNRPRPGHADLAGAIKYNLPEARYILERASARETTARVAVGRAGQDFSCRVRYRCAESCGRRGAGTSQATGTMGRIGRAERKGRGSVGLCRSGNGGAK